MLSPQVLGKGDQSTVLRPDRLTTTDGRWITHIPLAAIQEVRPDGDTALTIILTDGVPRRLTGGNAYAASAFLTALTAALPEQRDPAGSALITTEEGGRIIKVWQVWCGALALLAAYVGYVWWTGATHGEAMGFAAFFAAPGVLLGGLLSFSVYFSFDGRLVLRRRGITVAATRHYHPNGKRAGWYKYTDTSGNEHTTSYGANRTTEEIHVVYDAERPPFSLAVEPLYSTVVKHVLGGGASLAILGLGLWGVLAPYI
ncbi:hypothetical protein ASC82_23385 [Streptomyces sp. Root431]|uniref:hypothetical protein n=1 Tax=Streptomyces sp. Root431 TaxID=1736535 RepID=UPI0007014406|nr:hypothetical protein [Streptomyces sp. Root431]KQX10608.1 hypothetical protein ASC82_23385 [Streptomyces sp. Root431]